MPRAGAAAAGRDLHRQLTACRAVAPGHLLDGRLPHGGAWLERPSANAVLMRMKCFKTNLPHLAKRLECVKLASAFVTVAKRKQASRTPNASRYWFPVDSVVRRT